MRITRSIISVLATLPFLLSACGGGPSGPAVQPFPSVVIVDDAPILNARVQDRFGNDATMESAGQYRFEFAPELPLRVSSRNIVGVDGRVKVALSGGFWYSYDDNNNNNVMDDAENRQPLTFQDLDGNGQYTQSVDIVFNGAFEINYAVRGAKLVQANVVASLLPSNWDGVSKVAGLSSQALNAAISTGPSQSNDIELQRATVTLTAISEGLLSNLKSSGASGTTAAAQAAIKTALAAVADPSSQIDLTKTDATNVAKLAQAVSQVLPAAAQAPATNLVTNVGAVMDVVKPTSAVEAIVQLTQQRLGEFSAAANSTTQQNLVTDVKNAAVAITVAREEAVPNVDPDAIRIASLRLVPLGIPDPATEEASRSTIPGAWLELDSPTGTRGFVLARQSDGALSVSATGLPFQEVLGATSRVLPFVSARNSWEYTGANGQTLKIRINFSMPLFNNMGGTDSGALSQVSMMQLCSAAGACAFYIMATAQQLCSPDWAVLANAWPDISNNASAQFYPAVNTVNKTGVTCGA